MGSQGIYTHTVQYERDHSCPICSPGVPLEVNANSTLQQVRPGSKSSTTETDLTSSTVSLLHFPGRLWLLQHVRP